MSLVAYGSSDEGEDSDIDDNNEASTESQNGLKSIIHPITRTESVTAGRAAVSVTGAALSEDSEKHQPGDNDETLKSDGSHVFTGHISDEDDDILVENNDITFSSGLQLPPPKHETTTSNSTKHSTMQNSLDAAGLALKLPAPKSASSLASEIVEDELEDMVKPKAAELAQRPDKKTNKKLIKITAPNLPDFESDEEEEAKVKPQVPAGKCGLFSLLPKPKSALVKESGRLLIPHTLTKKPVAQKMPYVKPKPLSNTMVKASPEQAPQALPGVPVDAESEDEEEGSSSSMNFFSIGSDNSKSVTGEGALLSASSQTVMSSTSNLPAVKSHRTAAPATQPDLTEHTASPDTRTNLDEVCLPLHDAAGSSSDAPLQFKTNTTSFVGPFGQTEAYSELPSGGSAQHYSHSSQQYNMVGMDVTEYDHTEEAESEELPAEELIRLQGKRKWGREAINLIDVRADDHTSSADLTKNLTEEVDMHSHSKKNKKDQASSQQKRKHQITYLAQKAKEREFDLKNQWAQNKMTKMQSQSKYGF